MLILSSGSAIITAGTSTSNVGFGDGQSLLGSPNASFGGLSSTPAVIENASSTVPYIYYNGSGSPYFVLILKPNYVFSTIIVGPTTYAIGDSSATSYAGHTRYRWTTGVVALVNGTAYRFRAT